MLDASVTYNKPGCQGRGWCLWPSAYDKSKVQKCTSPKVFHWHCVKMFLVEGGKKYMECLVFMGLSFAKLKALPRDWQWGEGQLFRPNSQRGCSWSSFAIFLRRSMSFCLLCLMLRDILIPGSLILIADSGHRRPLGVAPLAPKEFRNRFFFRVGCGKWHCSWSLAPEWFRKAQQQWFF